MRLATRPALSLTSICYDLRVASLLVDILRMSVTRDKLYEEVWAEPMVRVAVRHGVSANYLARVCHHINVRLPQRGYWA